MWVAQDPLTKWIVQVQAVDRTGEVALCSYRYTKKSFMWPMEDVDVEFEMVYEVPVASLLYLNSGETCGGSHHGPPHVDR
jgi:hypothetical protein